MRSPSITWPRSKIGDPQGCVFIHGNWHFPIKIRQKSTSWLDILPALLLHGRPGLLKTADELELVLHRRHLISTFGVRKVATWHQTVLVFLKEMGWECGPLWAVDSDGQREKSIVEDAGLRALEPSVIYTSSNICSSPMLICSSQPIN